MRDLVWSPNEVPVLQRITSCCAAPGTTQWYGPRMERVYWVYILASRYRGALYIGVTGDIGSRTYAHRTGRGSIHAGRYRIWRLVYAESYGNVHEAIAREKQLKKWRRQWKIDLIEKANPTWQDLNPVESA
ncbi:MAG: GIY-YIG nuclease family protein [Bauldia sp.]